MVSPLLLVSPDRDTDWTQRMEKLHNFSSYHSLNKSSEVIKNLFFIAGGFQTFYVYIIISSMKVRKVLNYENEKNCKLNLEQGVEGSERKCNDRP